MVDGSGTINPAALNTPGKFPSIDSLSLPSPYHRHGCDEIAAQHIVSSLPDMIHSLYQKYGSCGVTLIFFPCLANLLPASSPSVHTQQNPRGQKRSRSPDLDNDVRPGGEDGTFSLQEEPEVSRISIEPRLSRAQLFRMTEADAWRNPGNQKAKKRGRASGVGALNERPPTSIPSVQNISEPVRTPQQPPALLPQESNTSPNQASPTKATPTKTPVVKALPTVRDHTTDQLTPEGDEYIPREQDPDGDRKVSPTGHPLNGREYRMRTFYMPNRGEKVFMLATECARVLGYRDSYLLFNKNRSLFKIIATQAEKDDLIQQEILPYSYRSRQIAIVTARSMFRQFGARVINNGRRVRDDYWEGKARKQGFTEEDMAGDKRPGATKARDAMALEAASNNQSGMARPNIDYDEVALPSELEGLMPPPPNNNTPISIMQTDTRDYGNIPRQRQDISGIPYQDRTQPSPASDVVHQANNAAELNKAITQQRNFRSKNYNDGWNRKIDPPVSSAPQKVEKSPTINQSPQLQSTSVMNPSQQPPILHQQAGSQLVSPQRYQQQPHNPNPHVQSPVRQPMPPSMRPEIQHPQRSSVYNPSQHNAPQTSPYGYQQPQPQLWGGPPPHPQPQSQPQQSPIASQHPSLAQHYSPSGHSQQLHHPSQPPHNPSPHRQPQLHHANSHSNLYGSMGGVPGAGPAYGGISQQRQAFGQQQQQQQQQGPGHSGSPNPQQQAFMQQTTAAQQAGMQGWVPPPMGTSGQGWGGYPASSGF